MPSTGYLQSFHRYLPRRAAYEIIALWPCAQHVATTLVNPYSLSDLTSEFYDPALHVQPLSHSQNFTTTFYQYQEDNGVQAPKAFAHVLLLKATFLGPRTAAT